MLEMSESGSNYYTTHIICMDCDGHTEEVTTVIWECVGCIHVKDEMIAYYDGRPWCIDTHVCGPPITAGYALILFLKETTDHVSITYFF